MSLRKTRFGCCARSTPPFQNSKPVGQLQVAGEHRALVGLAVAVGVLEDDQLVVHRRLRLPVGVVLPGRDPQPSLGVERHLHGLDQLGKLLLRREQLDLQSLADGHRLDGLLAALEGRRTRQVGLRIDEGQRVRVVHGKVRSAGDRPDALVAVGDHLVEDGQLALQDVVVARQDVFLVDAGHLLRIDVARIAAHERQERAIAVGRVAVGHAIAQEPMLVLVDHRLPQLAEQGFLMFRRVAEQRAVDDLRDLAVAFGVQVDALDRERRLEVGVELGGRREEIDERDVAGARDLGHRLGVERQALVVLLAVGQIRSPEILVGDGGEEHHARRGPTVVLLREGVRDPAGQVLLESLETGLTGERLVVAEEREHDVSLGVDAGEAIVFVAANRLRQPAQPLVGRAEVLRARAGVDLIAAEPEVAHDQPVLRIARLEHRLEPAVVLHPLGQRVADDADVVVRLQRERLLPREHRAATPASRQRPQRDEPQPQSRPTRSCLGHGVCLHGSSLRCFAASARQAQLVGSSPAPSLSRSARSLVPIASY